MANIVDIKNSGGIAEMKSATIQSPGVELEAEEVNYAENCEMSAVAGFKSMYSEMMTAMRLYRDLIVTDSNHITQISSAFETYDRQIAEGYNTQLIGVIKSEM